LVSGMVRVAKTTMKRGVVIFAYNSSEIDYQAMARWSAVRITRHLDLPTTLITDSVPADSTAFEDVVVTTAESGGTRHFADIGHNVTWYNGNRMEVYNLSPYDETLVLDADYVVCSDQLNRLFEISQDFLAPRSAYDVTGTHAFEDLNCFGANRMSMAWATVMRFNRSLMSKSVFDMMTMVRNNWQHYRNLYSIAKSTYRNDHALSIALNTLNGHQAVWPSVPWSLASVIPDHQLLQVSDNCFCVKYKTSDNKLKHVLIKDQDFHAMGKKHLGDIIASTN
jgi:hypothetical protein